VHITNVFNYWQPIIAILGFIIAFLGFRRTRQKPLVTYKVEPIPGLSGEEDPKAKRSVNGSRLIISNEGPIHAENLQAIIHFRHLVLAHRCDPSTIASDSRSEGELIISSDVFNPGTEILVDAECKEEGCSGGCIEKVLVSHKTGKGISKDAEPWFLLKIGRFEVSHMWRSNTMKVKIR
jgi:hypothetical protein